MLGPVKTVSGFGCRAQDRRKIGSGPRAGETFDVTVDTQVSALLEFTSGPIGAATFSFDSPTAFRELEVQGTEAVIRLPDPNRFDGSVLLYQKDMNKSAPDEWLKIPAETDWAEIPADGSAKGAAWAF
jgi:predicted dehydrogenase